MIIFHDHLRQIERRPKVWQLAKQVLLMKEMGRHGLIFFGSHLSLSGMHSSLSFSIVQTRIQFASWHFPKTGKFHLSSQYFSSFTYTVVKVSRVFLRVVLLSNIISSWKSIIWLFKLKSLHILLLSL